MMKKSFILYFLGVALSAFVIGCGSEGVVAKGKVTYDGEPIATGTITFIPAGGDGPTTGGPITNGTYSVNLPPGKYRVQIFGSRVTGTEIAGPGEVDAGQEREIVEEYVPANYNHRTTLTADLQQSNRSLDFNLEK